MTSRRIPAIPETFFDPVSGTQSILSGMGVAGMLTLAIAGRTAVGAFIGDEGVKIKTTGRQIARRD
jgi:hypothetical protein